MFKKHKNKIIIISLVVIGVLLIVFSSIKGTKSSQAVSFSAQEYTNELEKKVEGFLKNVKGIKKAEVIITLDLSNEKIYAQNGSNLDYIMSSNGEPIMISEKYPVVRGVAIACTNGDDDRVRAQITELISSYLGISSNRIKIVAIR